jgi:hypothetical protein
MHVKLCQVVGEKDASMPQTKHKPPQQVMPVAKENKKD